MLALGIDTSMATGSVGLHGDSGLRAELSLSAGLTHSETLLPAVRAVLQASGRALDQLDALAVATGPGSFTGLRIGMATAKGLALACGRPLLGFSTLETMAIAVASAWGGERSVTVCTLIDAGRGEIYRGLYAVASGTASPLLPESPVAPADLPRGIPEGCLIAGDAPYARRELSGSLPRGAHLVGAPPPIGALLAKRAVDLAGRRDLSDPPPLIPNYLRASDAERAMRKDG